MSNIWEKEKREAMKKGWKPVFDPGRVWGWNYYKKGDEAIWQVKRNEYVRAKLDREVSIYFVNQQYASLEEALKGEKNDTQRHLQSA
jgi:hypothetical protein